MSSFWQTAIVEIIVKTKMIKNLIKDFVKQVAS
jgi:hypothetical protein